MENINKIAKGKYSSYQILDVIEHGGMAIICSVSP